MIVLSSSTSIIVSGVSNNRQYQKGVQIIKAAVIAGDLNKVKIMCELWSADKRITLRKVDKDHLLQTLGWNGEPSKKQFVATLSEMVKSHAQFKIFPLVY